MVGAALVYSAVCVDAFLFEPHFPVLTEIELPSPLPIPITVLHLSDLHLETDPQRREQWLVHQLQILKPDLIVLTGDIHQTENFDVACLARVLKEVRAPLGVFACVGFDNVRVLREASPQITVLQNEAQLVSHHGITLGIAGLIDAGRHEAAFAKIASTDLRIVLNHTPDLGEEAAENGAHLYLCGHTHGGQVRIPFWGAIITNTGTGKRFEAGLYKLGGAYAYTSRGLGLEPAPAPPVRFFCRPEITLFHLQPVSTPEILRPGAL